MAAPLRAIRVPDDLWLAAQQVAQAQGSSLSQIMRDALFAYIETHTQ